MAQERVRMPGQLQTRNLHVAVVIPCFRVADTILKVIADMPALVDSIHVVDDACPEGSGARVEAECPDFRVHVQRLTTNRGVGGAMAAGYQSALDGGADVVVKVDGDGQMDLSALPLLLGPILRGEADYTKGNRFYDLRQIRQMPAVRIFGNAVLSFFAKLSSGYWGVFDPNNGYTAIHAKVLRRVDLAKLARRYFFESDMLFRLGTLRAVVVDVPMDARYGEERSNLRVHRVLHDFLFGHVRNTFKRVFYNYFLRNLSLASVQLVVGVLFLGLGCTLALWFWYQSMATGQPTLAGSVTLVAMLVIVGIQLLLGFLAHDMASMPQRPLHQDLADLRDVKSNLQ